VGNRLTKTDDGYTVNYTYDKNNRLISEGENIYIYDNNGNTTSKKNAKETISYIYGYNNRLISVVTTNQEGTSTVEYIYDADGIRVGKIVDGTKVSRYTVDRNTDYAKVLEERDENGGLVVSYVHGDDLISQKRGNVKSYYHYDGLGSTRALTYSSGEITDTYTYDAFGNLLIRREIRKMNSCTQESSMTLT
jgi:outer membrane lipoprotein-sorting protein